MAKTKKQLSPWISFCMYLQKKYPEKQYKDIVKLASKLKRKGSEYNNFVKDKTNNVVKKIKNVTKKLKPKLKKKRKSKN